MAELTTHCSAHLQERKRFVLAIFIMLILICIILFCKVYEVEFDDSPTDAQIQQLREGVVITTPIQRDSSSKKLITAKTLPCKIARLGQQLSR